VPVPDPGPGPDPDPDPGPVLAPHHHARRRLTRRHACAPAAIDRFSPEIGEKSDERDPLTGEARPHDGTLHIVRTAFVPDHAAECTAPPHPRPKANERGTRPPLSLSLSEA